MTVGFFREAKKCLEQSTCLKTKTGAVIVKDGKILSAGQNLCAPEGVRYGEAVTTCPRMNLKTGTGYELCAPIHAEVMACLNVRPGRGQEELARFAGHLKPSAEEIRSAFTKEELEALGGATLYLVGHYWVCDGCCRFTAAVGIDEICFDNFTAAKTKSRYEKEGLT